MRFRTPLSSPLAGARLLVLFITFLTLCCLSSYAQSWPSIELTTTPDITGLPVALNSQITLTATVSNSDDQDVVWSMNGGNSGRAGSLSTTTGLTTTYTAPSSLPTWNIVKIEATLASNPYVCASVSFLLVYPQWAQVGNTPGLTVPSDFIGLSHEWGDFFRLMGSDPAPNMAYRNLIGNIMNDDPAAPFLIRIGGSSTDKTGEPTLTAIQPLIDLYNDVGGLHYTLGINLGGLYTPIPTAVDQANFYLQNMPAGSVDVLELGNEPDGYRLGSTPMRCTRYAFIYPDYRCTTPDNNTYVGDFQNWRSAIDSSLASVGLSTKYMGPSTAMMKFQVNTTFWSAKRVPEGYLAAFEAQEGSAGANSIGIISQHFYDIQQGLQGKTFPPDYLLSDKAFTFYDDSAKITYPLLPTLQNTVAQVHSNTGQKFRLGEMNTIDTGGLPGLSNSFSSAIWATDMLFSLANIGVDGVNWQTTSGGQQNTRPWYNLFTIQPNTNTTPYTYTLDSVNPVYYGIYLFHKATPVGAQLLPITLPSSAPYRYKVWSTVAPNGTIYVVVLNKDTTFTGNVSVVLPGYGTATAYQLTDPNGYSGTITNTSGAIGVTGITFGGQTFDGSTDGTLQGCESPEWIYPENGVYSVAVDQSTMAVLLKIRPWY